MKEIFFTIVFLSSSLSCFSQESSVEEKFTVPHEICRAWFWTSEDGTEQFEIDLTEVDGALKGSHCSVAYNGRYIDCSDEDISIDLRPTGTNTFK